MSDRRRAYRDEVVRQRRELEPQISLRGLIIGVGLTVVSIAVAVLGVSVSQPVLSFLGLAAALGGAPLSIRAFVERTDSLARLRQLERRLERLEEDL